MHETRRLSDHPQQGAHEVGVLGLGGYLAGGDLAEARLGGVGTRVKDLGQN
tara:strand:+ start:678 stop:830 length:153 start_codon:yes stop_codon:yes gene_type:complete